MELWPSQLQQALNTDSFNLKFGDTTVRSGVDVGQDKVRARYTDAVDIYSATINLDYDDYTVFYDFYKTTLGNGVLTFEFDDPMTGIASEFRFAETPVIAPLGGRVFRIDMKWEKMP